MRIVYSVTTTQAHFFQNNCKERSKAKGGMRVVKVKKSKGTPQNHGGHMPVGAVQLTTEGTFTLVFIEVTNPATCRGTSTAKLMTHT